MSEKVSDNLRTLIIYRVDFMGAWTFPGCSLFGGRTIRIHA
jgi:hypothetical protein